MWYTLYFPTNTDISNYVYLANKSFELSKLDQENLMEKKVHKWRETNSIFFRPYVEERDQPSEANLHTKFFPIIVSTKKVLVV